MSLRVLQLSDLHLLADPDGQLKGIRPRETLRRIAHELQSELPRARRLVISGDLTHDERNESYAGVREILHDWGERLRAIPGNHDDRDLLSKTFPPTARSLSDRVTFVENVEGWTLLGLDSMRSGDVAGELGAAQREWLVSRLEAAASRPVGIFLHHPPVHVASRWLDAITLQDAEPFWDLLQSHDNVRFIAAGHVHQESVRAYRGVHVLTSPSTSVQFLPETESLVVDDIAPGYRVFELFADGGWRSWVRRVSGAM